jgi:dihydrofolate synthase/folylpolyglutamate synthase
MAEAVSNVRWPGRLQRLSHGPLVEAWGGGAVYVDGGHNVSAAHALAAWLRHQPQPVTLLWGMMQRKDEGAFLAPLVPFLQRVIAVRVAGEGESHTPQALAVAACAAGIANVYACETVADAVREIAESTAPHPASEAKGTLLIAGSLFLAGEILKNHA